MQKYRKRWYVLAAVAIALLLFNTGFYIMGKYYPNVLNKGNTKLTEPDEKQLQQDERIREAIKDMELNSSYAMLINLQNQRILYEKQAEDKLYPASLTKVMSAVVALDHISDLSQSVTVEEADLAGLAEANASVAGFQVGDRITYEELLYGLILPSGGDAANILANHLFGGMDAYVKEMNDKAASIGMNATHFVNATGLHEDEHYTTLQDLKKMMDHAWINTAFQKVMTTMNYEISSIELDVKSTLLMYGDTLTFEGGEIIGGKSGYTLEAECCLISIAKMEDGQLYMLLSAKAGGDPLGDHLHINDAKKLYEATARARLTQ